MSIAPILLAIEFVYQTSFNLYVVIVNTVTGQFWNTNTLAFENFNASNWAHYAVALTEVTGTGYYRGTFPAGIPAAAGNVLMSEACYIRAGGSPTIGDVPAAGLQHSQGTTVAAILGNAQNLLNLLVALNTEQISVVDSVPAANEVIAVTPPSANADNYIGRALIFADGDAYQQAYEIIAYDEATGKFTVSAPFLNEPADGDSFIVV